MGRNHLKDLPPLPRSLRTLFLLGNRFKHIPNAISAVELPRLRILSFKHNQLTSIPDNLPHSLESLILTSNSIQSIPPSLSNLQKLKKLMLANNQIRKLPKSMKDLKNLELVRLGNNRIAAASPWLLQMPSLAWIGMNDNPVLEIDNDIIITEKLLPGSFELGRKIGEGTSGRVYAGLLNGTKVAIKEYKSGCCSSDGLYKSEATLSMLPKHPNIIKVYNVFAVDGSLYVTMQWIEGMQPLGHPPSLESLTRDRINTSLQLTVKSILRILYDIASACRHLHENKIMHGDLYAHNILVDPESGSAVLGDFGAGFQYHNIPFRGDYFESVEVKAYGTLLRELLTQYPPYGDKAVRLSLFRLAMECNGMPIERPSFADVKRYLKRIACPLLEEVECTNGR